MRPLLRSMVQGTFGSARVQRFLASVAGPRGAIFFLHRFECFPGQSGGHREEDLVRLLEALRKARIDVVSVEEAVRFATSSGDSVRSRPFVAFSVDDCLWDFVDIALPVFRRFDAPVTGFVCPGLLARGDWFWWDKVWHVINAAERPRVFESEGQRFELRPLAASEGSAVLERLIESLKRLPHEVRITEILRLAVEMEVELPDHPPATHRLAPLSSLQAAESELVRFGAHTMTHPILSTCTDTAAHWEITESVRQVRQSFARPVNVFCYPNGTSADFGIRETQALEQCGVAAALTTMWGGVGKGSHTSNRYAIPRFTLGTDPAHAIRWTVLGR